MRWLGAPTVLIFLAGFPYVVIRLILALRENSRLRAELAARDATIAECRQLVQLSAQEHFATENQSDRESVSQKLQVYHHNGDVYH